MSSPFSRTPINHDIDWPCIRLALGIAIAALLVYTATLAPGLSFQHYGTDGGDLIAAARTLGVPHPSGYPTYTLAARIFTYLPFGSIAYRVNLLSAVSAAATAGMLFLCMRLLLPRHPHAPLVAGSTALVLAFSPLVWSQAVISEVYTLNALFATIVLFLVLRWRAGAGESPLYLAALVLGVGLGNHLTLAFLLPALLILVWPQRARLLRLRPLLTTTALFAIGLGVYAYLPIAASGHPPVNWGAPSTWRRFLWVVTAKQYQPFAFGLDPGVILARLAQWSGLLASQLGWWGLLMALLGALLWWKSHRPFALFSVTWSLPVLIYSFFYDTGDSHLYLIPVVLVLALAWGTGASSILLQARRRQPIWYYLALALVALLPVGSLVLHWRGADLKDDRAVATYLDNVLGAVEPDALMVVRGDRPTFSLWYALYAEERRGDVAVVSGPLLAYVWYRDGLRYTYPHLTVPEPATTAVTTDDLVTDLIMSNLGSHPVYATDPSDHWTESFRFVQEAGLQLFRVLLKQSTAP
jgi:hypothetical protein